MIEDTLEKWSRRNWLRVDEVAEFFGVHRTTIQRWWLTGKTGIDAFHPSQNGAAGLRFTAESVIAFVRRGFVTPEDYEEKISIIQNG